MRYTQAPWIGDHEKVTGRSRHGEAARGVGGAVEGDRRAARYARQGDVAGSRHLAAALLLQDPRLAGGLVEPLLEQDDVDAGAKEDVARLELVRRDGREPGGQGAGGQAGGRQTPRPGDVAGAVGAVGIPLGRLR